MKIGSPVPAHRARIEIIPLIDIMFFLLASFMMASLSMMKLQTIKMDLPAAAPSKRDFKPDIVNISVDQRGDIYIDKKTVNLGELHSYISNKYRVNTNLPVYISGDSNATHGSVVRVLDAIRREGVQKVSFATSPSKGAVAPSP